MVLYLANFKSLVKTFYKLFFKSAYNYQNTSNILVVVRTFHEKESF